MRMLLALARLTNCWKAGSSPGLGLNDWVPVAHQRGGGSMIARQRLLISERFLLLHRISSNCGCLHNYLLLARLTPEVSNLSASYCSTNWVSA
jgi:hypothetical protein